MSDGLFNPEAFEQIPGQVSMEQDEMKQDEPSLQDLAREIIAAVNADEPESDDWSDEQDRSDYFEARAEELSVLALRLASRVIRS